MASYRKRRGGYQVRWLDPDKRPRSRQVSTLASARALKREVEACEELGRRWEPEVTRAVPLIHDAAARYLRERARVLAPSYLPHVGTSLELFRVWADARGCRHIDGLSRSLLGEWFDDLRITGQRGARSVDTCRKNVDRVFGFWEWLYDDDEHSAFVQRPRRPDLPSERGGIPTVAPSWEEMDACIAAAGDDWQARALIVMRFTGLRVAQAMDLLWSDVDLDGARLAVRGGKSAQEKRGRVVPIAPAFVDVLAGWGLREGYVVQAPTFKRDGHERLRPRVFRSRDAARYWKRSGVREACWRAQPDHAFRKGFVSGLKRLEANDEAVEFLVGHSAGLRGIYVDPEALPLRSAVALVPPLSADGPVVALRGPRKRRS